jgi:hypothetical protein
VVEVLYQGIARIRCPIDVPIPSVAKAFLDTMNEDMKGKVVVIAGATSGIGQVAAESLAGMGAHASSRWRVIVGAARRL